MTDETSTPVDAAPPAEEEGRAADPATVRAVQICFQQLLTDPRTTVLAHQIQTMAAAAGADVNDPRNAHDVAEALEATAAAWTAAVFAANQGEPA